MQVSVPDTGCNVPYDIRGVRGQMGYQEETEQKENQSKCAVDIRCMRPGQGSGRIGVLSTKSGAGEDEKEDETRCNITVFGSRRMRRLTRYFAPCFPSTR